MKKTAIVITSILCFASALAAVGCAGANSGENQQAKVASIVNGGFESADLSGWTIEYGNAFDDSCVSSVKTFSFKNDEKQNRISVNQTGNWYLCGKGFDGKNSNARTGAIRST